MTIKSTFLKHYSFCEKPKIELLREGPDNDVFLIKDEKDNKMAVFRIGKRDLGDDVIFELQWLSYFHKKGLPVPEIIKTKEGKDFFIDDEGKVGVVFKYVKGFPIKIEKDKKPNLDLVGKAAIFLAKIHNLSFGIKFNLSRKRNIFTEVNRALAIAEKLIKYQEGGKEFIEKINFYKNFAQKNFNNYYLIHNDYRAGNVFFDNGQVSAILDFDWSCIGPSVKDLSLALVEWSYPDGEEKHFENVFDTFLDSYNQEAKNKIKKDNNLYSWICFSCLSDAATYFSDLASQNIYKKTSSCYMYKKFLYFERFLK
jgi:Ser/Thr protein kinase RdoA (MazF antagonist)